MYIRTKKFFQKSFPCSNIVVLQEVQEQSMMTKKENYFTNIKELKNIKTTGIYCAMYQQYNEKCSATKKGHGGLLIPMVLLDCYGEVLSNMLCLLLIGWKNYYHDLVLMEQ